MFPTSTLDTIQARLLRIYREFSNDRRVNLRSRMVEMWEDPCVEVLVGSRELVALETEFGVEFNENSALLLYEKELAGAARQLLVMRQVQEKQSHHPDNQINILPELARQILLELWQTHFKMRQDILVAFETVNFRK